MLSEIQLGEVIKHMETSLKLEGKDTEGKGEDQEKSGGNELRLLNYESQGPSYL